MQATMQLSAEILEILPRAGPSVAGLAPAISKATRNRIRSAATTSKSKTKLIAGAFVEITTQQKATRVHRNRQLAATTLAVVKETLSKLESNNASLKKRDEALSERLSELLAAVAAATTANEA
eukprot:COSAG02_NODE_2828_length_7940_cov_6.526081_2_plen_123_part_00